ncbi:MAG TPA: hypothetical protein VFS00_34990, partial [Polyangiaceae bacterium]|nr:hypothetical protein [Polyangiaceae bacterium]
MSEAKSAKGGRRPSAGAPGGRTSSHGGGRKVNRGRTPPTPPAEAPPPELSVKEGPLGRETLMELQDELRATPWPRAPMTTVGYHEVPLDGSGARAGPLPPEPPAALLSRARHPRDTSAPEIEVSLTEVSLRALTLLDGDSSDEGPPSAADAEAGASPFDAPPSGEVASSLPAAFLPASRSMSKPVSYPPHKPASNPPSKPASNPPSKPASNPPFQAASSAPAPPSRPPSNPTSQAPAPPARSSSA